MLSGIGSSHPVCLGRKRENGMAPCFYKKDSKNSQGRHKNGPINGLKRYWYECAKKSADNPVGENPTKRRKL